jgi:hypothetical protein
MKRKYKDGTFSYGIHEVYFYESGKIDSWTRDEIAPYGETLEELTEDFKFQKEALHRPVLDYETGKEVGK